MAMLPVQRSGRNLTVVNPSLGRFEFHTYLPGDVNADSVNAQLSDGVLTLAVPKSEKAKPRHIEIKG